MTNLIPPHGGYRNLKSFQTATLIYDLTVEFCNSYMSYKTNGTNKSHRTYLEKPESAANCLICLIHQANFLLDRQLKALEKSFLEEGGFAERLYQKRTAHRANMINETNRYYRTYN